MSPVIVARDLAIGFPPDPPLLESATFEIDRGEIFAVLGGSGCGKSTLLRCLIGLEQPLAGTLLVEGSPPEMKVGKPTYGVSFQHGALLGSLTLEENLALPLTSWTDLPDEAIAPIVRAKLAMVGLDGAAHRLPSEISGGMRKRAAIARALMLEPTLLFLDEPSAGLDPITSAGLDELILTLRRTLGLTVVIVSHELPSIERIVDRSIVLDAQARRIVATGAPKDLAESDEPRVSDFFHRRWRAA